ENAEPVTIEVLLQSLLRGGRSLTQNDVKRQIQRGSGSSSMYWMGDYDYSGGYGYYDNQYADYDPATYAITAREGRPFYRVDPNTRTAIVVATEEDQKRISDAITQVVEASTESGKMVAKLLSTGSTPFYYLQQTFRKIAPSVQIINTESSSEFVAYGIESEVEKISTVIDEVKNASTSGDAKEMLVITIPAGSRYSRERIIQMLSLLYPPQYPFFFSSFSQPTPEGPVAGPEPNQIIVYNLRSMKDKIQKTVDEVCKPLPEGQQATYKTYSIKYIEVADAIKWLKEICPNATVQEDTPKIDYITGTPMPNRVLVILAAPIEHLEIEKALADLDQDLPPDQKRTPKLYTIRELSFYSFVYTLRQIAPESNFSGAENAHDFLAYATVTDHEKIKNFVDELNAEGPPESKRHYGTLKVPEGTRYARETIAEMVSAYFPQLYPWPAPEVNQIVVFGHTYQIKKAQELVDTACSPLPEGEAAAPKWYPLHYITTASAIRWLQIMYPNVTVTADTRPDEYNGVGVIVIATPLEHVLIKKTLDDLDIDVPENLRPFPKMYDLSEFPQGSFWQIYASVVQGFPFPQITATLPSSDRFTLLITATEQTHERVGAFLDKHKAAWDLRKERLELHFLQKTNFYKISPLLTRMVPKASIYAGTVPNEVYVYANAKDQADIADAIKKIEMAALRNEQEGAEFAPSIKIYRIASKNAYSIVAMFQNQFPAAIVFPTSTEQILAWASHE
ncbi:MAG: hypothetical protein ACRC2T_14605, partial [Thermoguttaceae bacterium]